MDPYIVWFVGAALLVAVELFAGTLYLLIAAVGAAAAGGAALAGGAVWTQFLAAALVAIAGFAWLRHRGRNSIGAPQTPKLSFDVGQRVEVLERHSDGTLRVAYRGSHWDAEIEAGAEPVPGAGASDAPYVIREVRGTRLVVGARKI